MQRQLWQTETDKQTDLEGGEGTARQTDCPDRQLANLIAACQFRGESLNLPTQFAIDK